MVKPLAGKRVEPFRDEAERGEVGEGEGGEVGQDEGDEHGGGGELARGRSGQSMYEGGCVGTKRRTGKRGSRVGTELSLVATSGAARARRGTSVEDVNSR